MNENKREEQYQAYMDYAMNTFSDVIPYDDPEYDEKLIAIAKAYADAEIYGYPDESDMEIINNYHINVSEQLDYHDKLPF